jgi:hypothetical protein
MICQTPDHDDYFTSMALTYDAQRRLTQGILGLTCESTDQSEFLYILNDFHTYGEQFLLLPTLLYWCCAGTFRRELRTCDSNMKEVQTDTGLLDNFLRRERNPEAQNTVGQKHAVPDHQRLHQKLVEQHASMTRGLSTFVTDLGVGCHEGLEKVVDILETWGRASAVLTLADFSEFLEHIDMECKFHLHNRERLMSRVNIQLQVVGVHSLLER